MEIVTKVFRLCQTAKENADQLPSAIAILFTHQTMEIR